jgi:UDP-glucose 4-epimerase
MKILLTGASGLFGINLAEKISSNHDVVCLCRGEHNMSSNLDVLKADISKPEDIKYIKREYGNFDVVINSAANVREHSKPEDMMLSNVLGPINLSSIFNDSRLIHMSSMSVYSRQKTLYSMTKYLAEEAIESLHPNYVFLRMTYLYGPHDTGSRIYHMALHAMRNEPIEIENGSERRDYLYIDDAVSLMERLLDTEVYNDFFDIGTGNTVEMEDIARIIKEYLGSNSEIIVHDRYPVEWKVEPTKAENTFGWNAQYGIEEGIKRFMGGIDG